jgi:dihydrofolate synthase/folylpolyglutamate synthase
MKFPFWPDQIGYRNIDLGLTRVYQLLERLGNPHLKLPPTIHLAGTNGKGSTLAFLKSIFTEAGLKTHTYTSPHLVSFNERITLAGKEISDTFLNEILSSCKIAAETEPKINITYFEGITVAAFLAFSKVKADILLLETGMGGRLDATNVLPKNLCSIITPIDLDHQEFLGETVEKIAFEKAGIIKRNCPVIIGKQQSDVLKVIEKQAAKLNAKIFHYEPRFEAYENSLIGSHQKTNAALAATAAITQQEFSISEEQIKSGLKKTEWNARLQKITSGKFHKTLDKSCTLYLDGSHNLAGAKTLQAFLKSQTNTKKIVIFGMLKDKDCQGFLNEIKDEIDEIIAVKITDEDKSRSGEEIEEVAKNLNIKSQVTANISNAFSRLKNEENALILVCGSLYLAGEFMEGNLEDILKKMSNN